MEPFDLFLKKFFFCLAVTLHGLTAMASVFSELRRPLRGVGTPIPAPTVNVGTGVGVTIFPEKNQNIPGTLPKIAV